MRQGLIAEWSRGIAGRGLIGAALLTVPVMVAATIGFGGANGLSSLASGPSDAAIGRVSGAPLTTERNIESLTATTVSLPTREQAEAARTGTGEGSTFVAGAGGTSTAVDNGSGSEASVSGSGSVSGSASGAGTETTPAEPPSSGGVTGLGINNPGGGGQQGLVGQILQGLSNPNQ